MSERGGWYGKGLGLSPCNENVVFAKTLEYLVKVSITLYIATLYITAHPHHLIPLCAPLTVLRYGIQLRKV